MTRIVLHASIKTEDYTDNETQPHPHMRPGSNDRQLLRIRISRFQLPYTDKKEERKENLPAYQTYTQDMPQQSNGRGLI